MTSQFLLVHRICAEPIKKHVCYLNASVRLSLMRVVNVKARAIPRFSVIDMQGIESNTVVPPSLQKLRRLPHEAADSGDGGRTLRR